MLDKITKSITHPARRVWMIKDDDNKEQYYAEFVVSDATPDRDGDIVEQDFILDNFMRNPVCLWGHDTKQPAIGVWESIKTDGQRTIGVLRFSKANALGMQMYHQVAEGTIRAVSISFVPHEKQEIKDENGRITGWRYKRNELLEISLVNIPANANALLVDTPSSRDMDINEIACVVAKMLGLDLEMKGATQYLDLPLDMERDWNADAARARLAKWASSDGSGDKDKMDWPKYRKGFAWWDDENPENFGSYKLPYADIVDGELTAIWRGVVAVMGAILGARGGADIPEADRRKVYEHMVKYYKKAEKEPPPFKTLETDEITERLMRVEQRLDTISARIEALTTKQNVKPAKRVGYTLDELVRALKQGGEI